MKVVYKPVRRFREEGGLISKTVTYTYKQVTELINTRKELTVITFTDQLPKSQDVKLKVNRFYVHSVVVSRNSCCQLEYYYAGVVTGKGVGLSTRWRKPLNHQSNQKSRQTSFLLDKVYHMLL